MYLDPSSWGIVIQILIGAVVAVPVLMGIYWGRVKGLFSRRRGNDGSDKETK